PRLADGRARQNDGSAGPLGALEAGIELVGRVEVHEATVGARFALWIRDQCAADALVGIGEDGYRGAGEALAFQRKPQKGLGKPGGAVEVADEKLEPIQGVLHDCLLSPNTIASRGDSLMSGLFRLARLFRCGRAGTAGARLCRDRRS